MSNVFFISDTHFGHENIIKPCHRPFANADEMDEALIKSWNDTVKPGDRVYHLGDFSFHRPEKTNWIISRLSGQKFLIKGNHDWSIEKWAEGFIWIRDLEMIRVGEQKIVLSHYAMRVWNCSHYGAWNLHGHSHGTLPRLPGYKQADMGVDCWGYRPVPFEEIRVQMDKIKFKPVDAHGR